MMEIKIYGLHGCTRCFQIPLKYVQIQNNEFFKRQFLPFSPLPFELVMSDFDNFSNFSIFLRFIQKKTRI